MNEFSAEPQNKIPINPARELNRDVHNSRVDVYLALRMHAHSFVRLLVHAKWFTCFEKNVQFARVQTRTHAHNTHHCRIIARNLEWPLQGPTSWGLPKESNEKMAIEGTKNCGKLKLGKNQGKLRKTIKHRPGAPKTPKKC